MNHELDILIIDDDEKLTEILSTLLEFKGFKVEKINDSTIAYSFIRSKMPKIIILDLMMPEVDGLRLLKTIKEDPEMKKIKVIVYSGKAFDVDKRLAMTYGADAFLNKPAKAKILLEKINSLMSQYV